MWKKGRLSNYLFKVLQALNDSRIVSLFYIIIRNNELLRIQENISHNLILHYFYFFLYLFRKMGYFNLFIKQISAVPACIIK